MLGLNSHVAYEGSTNYQDTIFINHQNTLFVNWVGQVSLIDLKSKLLSVSSFTSIAPAFPTTLYKAGDISALDIKCRSTIL